MTDTTTTTELPRGDQPEGQTRILIYTDGSCIENPGPGGWAATVRHYEGEALVNHRALSGNEAATTNNRMEMTAAIKALGSLGPDETAPIIIRTDSQILVRGMTEWLPGWIARGWRKGDGKPVMNSDLYAEIIRLSEGRNITWQWVRGHAGEPMNEEVDAMANAEALDAQAARDAT
jgi:ribonuclease HI